MEQWFEVSVALPTLRATSARTGTGPTLALFTCCGRLEAAADEQPVRHKVRREPVVLLVLLVTRKEVVQAPAVVLQERSQRILSLACGELLRLEGDGVGRGGPGPASSSAGHVERAARARARLAGGGRAPALRRMLAHGPQRRVLRRGAVLGGQPLGPHAHAMTIRNGFPVTLSWKPTATNKDSLNQRSE